MMFIISCEGVYSYSDLGLQEAFLRFFQKSLQPRQVSLKYALKDRGSAQVTRFFP